AHRRRDRRGRLRSVVASRPQRRRLDPHTGSDRRDPGATPARAGGTRTHEEADLMSGPRPSIPRRLRSAFSEPGVRFSLIWQVFLVYPVLAVLSADSATPWTVLGLASVAAFAVVYLASFASPAITEGFPL